MNSTQALSKTIQTNQDSQTKTTDKPFRWSARAAICAGILYLLIQPLHPEDTLAAVVTGRWEIVHLLSLLMDALGLAGLTGIFLSQAQKVGKVGLIGYLLFSFFFLMTFAFHFVESFISPILAKTEPGYVEGMLQMISGDTSDLSLGAIPVVYAITGVAYMLGGLLLGIATYRANILSRWSGGLLAAGAAVTLFGAAIPHPLNRIMAIPVGIALIWMGISLFQRYSPKRKN